MKSRAIDPPSNVTLAIRDVAAAYNQAGQEFVAYADGDTGRLFAFEGLHSYADRRLWSLVRASLRDLREAGADSVSILDAGCGAGIWLRSAVSYARALGFSTITARGFDFADTQIQRARALAQDLAQLPGVHLTFNVADLGERLPEADASVDIAFSLYTVLSHLPVKNVPEVVAHIARVNSGHVATSVRSVGSTPTIFVASLDKAGHFQLDQDTDQCEFELAGGRRMVLASASIKVVIVSASGTGP
jgi:SAM-dependent methyltransferase